MRLHNFLFAVLALSLSFVQPADAQCGQGWIASPEVLGDKVDASIVLSGGDLLIGGEFTRIGGTSALRVARRDAATGRWSALGEGFDGLVQSLAEMSNGDIVAGGLFTHSGGTTVNHIARWNGTAWLPLGAGADQSVQALAPLPTGELFVGGTFQHAGGLPIDGIARWDGNRWHAMLGTGGSGLQGVAPYVSSMVVLPTGNLIVAGRFSSADGVPANSVARWDGHRWSSLGDGLDGFVYALDILRSGEIVAAGYAFGVGGTTTRVARWDGSAWIPMGRGIGAPVRALQVLPDGRLVAGGEFGPILDPGVHRLAVWDGLSWVALGNGVEGPYSSVWGLAVLQSGDLVVGGHFDSAGGVASVNLATYTFGGPCCQADIDDDGLFSNGPHRDQAVTVEDLLFFLAGFETGSAQVDLDNGSGTGTPDGAVTIEDLLFFLAHFEAGC